MSTTRDTQAPRRARVLHLVSTFAIKTDTKWLIQLARHLDRSAFELSVACFYEGGPAAEQLEALGVPTFNLNVPNERDPRAIARAKRLIRRLGSDVVHTHLLRADLWGGVAARWAGVPVIVSTAYAMGAYRRAKRRRSDSVLDRVCAALPTHTIAVSEAVKRDCVERLRMNPADVTVIHTGIDPPGEIDPGAAAAFRERCGVGADQPLVITVGRLSYEKGIDVLVDAAAAVCKTHPQARFVVVGEGPDRESLQARIQQRGLDLVVTLAGFEADAWPVLAAADVVCMPSKSEGMPNALLEAMAVGRPIVATNVGGIPEAIESGRNGLLVGPGDPAALAAGLARLIDDKALALQLAAAAKQTVEEWFHAAAVAPHYAALYKTLLGRLGMTCSPVGAATVRERSRPDWAGLPNGEVHAPLRSRLRSPPGPPNTYSAGATPGELPRPVEVLGLPIRPLRTDAFVDLLVQRARSGLKTTVCYANAHTANLACRDATFRRALCDSDILYADGASVVWASRWSSARLPERMTSADYFPRFARRCAEEGLSIYLLGGREGVAREAARRLCNDIPDLRIAGVHHGYLNWDEAARVVAEINAAGADVLAVGLSSPRQERFLTEHAQELKGSVRWCVGALFDYLAGAERRAPAWLCRMGGEWLFRLLADPFGKWRRYLIGNPLFVWNVLSWRMGKLRIAARRNDLRVKEA